MAVSNLFLLIKIGAVAWVSPIIVCFLFIKIGAVAWVSPIIVCFF
jgi:hypothetical protein